MSTADVPADGAAAVPTARSRVEAKQWISWVALAMMTTSSVASLRAAPTMAVYGLACVFLYLLPAVVGPGTVAAPPREGRRTCVVGSRTRERR